jgi:hypothetical protein
MIKNIPLDPGDLHDLGELWAARVEAMRTARDELMSKTWKQSLENYEGKAPPIDIPWPDASNAHVPLTATHVDAFQARFYNAATTHDPVYVIMPRAADDVIAGVPTNDFADAMQEFSKQIERHELSLKEVMEEVTTLVPKYGDAFVVIDWEHQQVVDYEHTEDGDPVKSEPRDLVNRPVLKVVHPRNFYMSIADRNIQRTPWCAVDVMYTVEDIRRKVETGEWYKEEANEVLRHIGKRTPQEQRREQKSQGWFRPMADGRMLAMDEWEQEQLRLMRAGEIEDDPGRVKFVKIWAYIDADKDGIPEDVQFLVHLDSKRVVQARWNPAMHKSRAIVHYYFLLREGTWLSIGVAEMLFNIQKIMNDVMRDMLNNNQVKNAKVFVGKADGDLTDETVIYPNRLLLLKNPGDFDVKDMGSGQMSVSVTDLQILQGWGERRDGITDQNLGRERSSRTPATTLMTLLEEGNERIVRVIDRMRTGQEEMWKLILALYVQNGADEIIDSVLSPEQGALLRSVWETLSPADIMRSLKIEAKVSTKAFNRMLQRQETLALFGQMEVMYKRLFSIAQIFRQTQDPKMQELLIQMTRGMHTLMRRVLNTYDEKDQRDLNPDIVPYLEQLQSLVGVEGIPENVEGNPFAEPGRSDQVQQTRGFLENQGTPGVPENVPGRPVAGQPRVAGQ